MTVVVTGASGHIGANLVRELLRRGEKVRVLDYHDDGSLQGLPVEPMPGDVCDPPSLRRAFEGADVLYHLAAVISIDGDRTGSVRAVNVEGARNVARAALHCGIRRMVHFSSVHAFDQHPLDQPLDETRARVPDRPRKHPAYDRTKAAGERAVREVIAEGLDAVIVHPAGVIGPHDFAPSRMGRFFIMLYHEALAAVTGGGFNWVDARDVVNGALAAACSGRRGESYLLGGHWCSMQDLAAIACHVLGKQPPSVVVPMALAQIAAPGLMLLARAQGKQPLVTPEALRALRGNARVSTAKAERELRYRVRPLADTVHDAYAFFAEMGLLDGERREDILRFRQDRREERTNAREGRGKVAWGLSVSHTLAEKLSLPIAPWRRP